MKFALVVILVLVMPFASAQTVQEVPTCKQNGKLLGATATTTSQAGSIVPCRLPDNVSLQTTSTMLTIVGALFGLGVGLGLILFIGIRRLYRIGKARILFLDPDARSIREMWMRPQAGKVETKSKTFFLDGLAKFGGSYSTWLIHPEFGWNFVAPTRRETVEKDFRLAVLSASNPETAHRAIHRARWPDIMRAGQEDDKGKWIIPVAIIALIALIVLLGMVGYLISHLPTPGGAASG